MLFILDKGEQTVGVLSNVGNINKITPYFDDTHILDLENGSESYEFSTFGDTKEASNLEVGNFIAFDYKGETKLFTIIEVVESHEDIYIKKCYCESCGLELLNNYVRPRVFTGVNIKMFLEEILIDTPFKLGKVDLSFTEVKDIEISNFESVYKLIQDIAIGEFGLEVSFRAEIVNNKVVNKYIDIYYKRGRRNLFRFEYSVNMSKVERKVDATELCTALIGIGSENLDFKNIEAEDKPLGQDFIVNKQAFEVFNIRGRHIFGVYKCESNSPDEILKLTREEMKKRGVPKITYDLDVSMLGEDIQLGDTVYIIDNTFNPALHLEARVQKLELHKTDFTADTCTLSNFKEVKSNINDDMRSLKDKLVYVSNKFNGDVEGLRDKIEALQVGGRNLLLDSVRKVTNNSYPTAIFTLSQEEPYIEGAEYTLTIKGKLGDGKRHWGIYNSGATLQMTTISEEDKKDDGRYVKTFKWVKGEDVLLSIYPMLSSVNTDSTIEWVKLEFGNVASDHSYAQEDLDRVVDDKINNTETILNQNIDNSVQDATNDILTNVADKYVDRITITEMQSGISSKFEQTNEHIELNFNRVNDYTVQVGDELNQYKEEVKTHIRFSENGMELGQVNSPFSATLDSKKLAFLENNQEVAYISNNKMYITETEINNSLKIGNDSKGFFIWQGGKNGNLSFKWSKS